MTEPRRVLVTGSRFLQKPRPVWDALNEQLEAAGGAGIVVVHGDCPTGADAFAKVWAQRHGQQQDPHAAQWDTCTDACRHESVTQRDGSPYCPAAGPRRDQVMVDKGADVVLAFPRVGMANKGTMATVRMAETADLDVKLYTQP